MVASQLMKTQIALNWIGGLIHMAPSNILTLLPSLGLAKRVSARIGKTIKATPVLRERIATGRDAVNTMDTKEFEGGSLYVTTAGSAANLSELSARYIYGDEIDRWEVDIGEEGDPIELAETRASTFGRNAKFYFSSSPTIKGASRIADLFEGSDQRHFYVPCPDCGHMQVLEWERLHYSDDFSTVHYECAGTECDVLIEEHHKGEMLAKGEWRAHAEGDGETVGFHLNALYSPPGWMDWRTLAMQFEKAKIAQNKGDLEPMQVFYNTRLAKVWDSAQEQTKAEVLIARARLETYTLGTMAVGALMLTGAVDVQAIPHEKLREAATPDATLIAQNRPPAQPTEGYKHPSCSPAHTAKVAANKVQINARAEFEKEFPVPEGLQYCTQRGTYITAPGAKTSDSFAREHYAYRAGFAAWSRRAWKHAALVGEHAQGVQL